MQCIYTVIRQTQDGLTILGYTQNRPVNGKKTLKCVICRMVLCVTIFGYMQDRLVNNKSTKMRYMQDLPAYNPKWL